MIQTVLLTAILAVSAANDPAPAPRTAINAKQVFEQLKMLVGRFEGQEKDGRKIVFEAQLIAADSVIMSRSWYEAHPGEMMVNMYHLDGDKLMLTHYCVAKNQPRLRATEISADGKEILFTFHDATGIATRDQGHMDKAVYTLVDKDTLKSRWTWYAKGKEQWMEEFVYYRAGTKPASDQRPSTKVGLASSPGECCASAGS